MHTLQSWILPPVYTSHAKHQPLCTHADKRRCGVPTQIHTHPYIHTHTHTRIQMRARARTHTATQTPSARASRLIVTAGSDTITTPCTHCKAGYCPPCAVYTSHAKHQPLCTHADKRRCGIPTQIHTHPYIHTHTHIRIQMRALILKVCLSEAVFHFCLRRNGHFVPIFRQYGEHLRIENVSISGLSSKTFLKTANWQICIANRVTEKDILYGKETDFGHKYFPLFVLEKQPFLPNRQGENKSILLKRLRTTDCIKET